MEFFILWQHTIVAPEHHECKFRDDQFYVIIYVIIIDRMTSLTQDVQRPVICETSPFNCHAV